MKILIGLAVLLSVVCAFLYPQKQPEPKQSDQTSGTAVISSRTFPSCSEDRPIARWSAALADWECTLNTPDGKPHIWASDLIKKDRPDGWRWRTFDQANMLDFANYNLPFVSTECKSAKPACENCAVMSIACQSYILDFCLEHGETRVVRHLGE